MNRQVRLVSWYIAVGAAMLCPAESTLEEVPTYFQCNADKKSDRIRLYLGLENLKINCYLHNDYSNSENQDIFSTLYTSKGLAPSLKLYNSTHAAVFNFQMSLNTTTWSIDIPRNHITLNADVAPVDEWYLQFKMHHGLDIFSTEGTLLDTVREPLLQWTIGSPISSSEVGSFINNAVNLQVSKSPCANDVAVLAPVFAPQTSAGIILIVTKSGFTSMDNRWFNCTDSLCGLLNGDCNGLAVVDVTLTSFNLLILTTRGLFISENLTSPVKSNLNFKKLDLPISAEVDHSLYKLLYTPLCSSNMESFHEDYLSLTSSKPIANNQNLPCLNSTDPFTDWYRCLQHGNSSASLIHDVQQDTGIVLSLNKNQAFVTVYSMIYSQLNEQIKFPPFQFEFLPEGISFDPNSHQLYVYGAEVDYHKTTNSLLPCEMIRSLLCHFIKPVIWVPTTPSYPEILLFCDGCC